MSAALRLGILGGTFDPIHRGHMDLAEACLRELNLDQVRFLPSRTPPHKAPPVASEYHRHAMVVLATMGTPAFVADPRELERGGVSYTIDTLDELRADYPEAELFFLTGLDSLRDLRTWRRWQDILERATFVACDRGGLEREEILSSWSEYIEAGSITCLAHQPPAVSSSALREGLREKRSLEASLPEAVFHYLQEHELYVRALANPVTRSVP